MLVPRFSDFNLCLKSTYRKYRSLFFENEKLLFSCLAKCVLALELARDIRNLLNAVFYNVAYFRHSNMYSVLETGCKIFFSGA